MFASFSKNTLTPNFEPKHKRKTFFKGPEGRWYRDVTTSWTQNSWNNFRANPKQEISWPLLYYWACIFSDMYHFRTCLSCSGGQVFFPPLIFPSINLTILASLCLPQSFSLTRGEVTSSNWQMWERNWWSFQENVLSSTAWVKSVPGEVCLLCSSVNKDKQMNLLILGTTLRRQLLHRYVSFSNSSVIRK